MMFRSLIEISLRISLMFALSPKFNVLLLFMLFEYVMLLFWIKINDFQF